MKLPSPRAFITVVVLVLIINNFIVQKEFIPQMTLSRPAELRLLPPGYHMRPLKAHLAGVRIAGYYTDRYSGRYWLDPQAAVYLQRSQYALSPTLLDIEQCFKHEQVVFECDKPGCFRAPIEQYGYALVAVLNDRFAIARRK